MERPQDYRTPSPPPWSPILSPIDAESLEYNHSPTRLSTQRHFDHPASVSYLSGWPPHSSGKHGHHPTGSMDAFASIALATLHKIPPSHTGKRVYGASHNNSRAKRARTELPSPAKPRDSCSRPATSYEQSYEARVQDAQLLLYFSQEVRDRRTSEPARYHGHLQRQGSLNRLVTSQVTNDLAVQALEGNTPFHIPPSSRSSQQSCSQHKTENGLCAEKEHVNTNQQTELSLTVSPNAPQQAKVPPSSFDSEKATSSHVQDHAYPGPDTSGLHTPENGSGQGTTYSDTQAIAEAQVPVASPSKGLIEKYREYPRQTPPHQPLQPSLEETRPVAQQEICLDVMDRLSTYKENSPGKHSTVAHANPNEVAEDNESFNVAEEPCHTSTADAQSASNDASGSNAICAACKFSKNSVSIDSENNATSWISCDGCKSWFHFACAGFKNEREVRSVDKYRCKQCKPIHGATSFVRKSARAHTAIDYAGLHQGVVKTSDDRPEHHYIQPIKDGTISFLPENFPRMRPELVTAEYFEKGHGMREPILIPASLNPRPNVAGSIRSPNGEIRPLPNNHCFEENADLEDWLAQETEPHRVIDDGQDGLDMVMPRGLTVRKVAELYGPEEKIEVIDVKSQNGEGKKWNMRRWTDYYEKEDENKVIRNVISLEVSQSRLGKLIRRPQIVRDLDLQDAVWPEDLLAKGEYPHVQFYCLMSVADSFTDFHIDFGGSSVFYHILKGKKTFLFIPPKEKHLKKYEEWCMSPAQNWTFLPDQTHECYRVDLSEGDTMLIPSGWIHAVWTPEDSLVIGGNFLTRLNFGMQLRIAQVEKNTGVARKFRYPYFQKLHWFTVFQYLEEDPLPSKVREHLESGFPFEREVRSSDQFNDWGENSKPGPENFHARYYSQAELEGLPDLLRYVLRTVLIENGTITEGISAETRNAVRKSIPRSHGEPMQILKKFAIWCAWKRGNEPIPHWAYPGAVLETAPSDKLSAARKLAEEAALKAPRRQSQRMQSQKEAKKVAYGDVAGVPYVEGHAPIDTSLADRKRPAEQAKEVASSDDLSPLPNKPRLAIGSAGSHRKTACDTCRRRRRACKHKEIDEPPTANDQHEPAKSTMVHKDAFLNGNALQEKLSSIGGLFNSLTAKTDGGPPFAINQGLGPERMTSGTANPPVLSDIPTSPFLASSTSIVATHSYPCGDLATTSDNSSPSRPRTKACNHCRKSKRRCIHDAFGNEDPIKVAESAVPRPHARKINKPETSGKSYAPLPNIYPHLESVDQDVAGFAASINSTGVAPTANMVAEQAAPQESDHESQTPMTVNQLDRLGHHRNRLLEGDMASKRDESEQLPPPLHANEPPAVLPALGSDTPFAVKTASSYGRVYTGVEFIQASTSLVSPPASAHEATGESPPAAEETPTKSRALSREASQPPHGHFQRYTPESGPIRKSSHSPSRITSVGREPQKVKKRRSTSAQDADEESLRLIKELQAQDLGLRRRAKVL